MSLAIVIPAFKSEFFNQTLRSINNQSDRDFTLYIGDDNSPDNLEEIVKSELTNIKYFYKKFDSNLGKEDLVAQWNRCIDLTVGEPWLWLFSDDDYMDENCVEEFYEHSRKYSSKLFRFNKVIVDEKNNALLNAELPKFVSDIEFIKEIGIRNKSITMPEYVFHRDLYHKYGIISFDLAWSSDLATWIQYVIDNKGLYSIQGANVYFRKSSSHLSGKLDFDILQRKAKADAMFLIWLRNMAKSIGKSREQLAVVLKKYGIDRYRKFLGSKLYDQNYKKVIKKNSFKILGLKYYIIELFRLYQLKKSIRGE